jgi:hypothetical protein
MKKPSATRWCVLAWLTLVGLATGCSTHEAQVSGTVSYKGQPLDHGTVRFEPTGGGAPAYSDVATDGSYELRTGRETGLKPGEYRATVVALEENLDWAGPGPPPPGKAITPLWYQNLDTSGLQYTVEPGSNEFDIELNDTPPAGWRPPPPRRG